MRIDFQKVKLTPSEIVFKTIRTEDFEPFGYKATFHPIKPSAEGYISEQVVAELDFKESNTVIINAGVGQGKTHTILEIAQQYHKDGYLILFAVPYKSLIDQYQTDLIQLGIPQGQITDYRKIGAEGDEGLAPAQAAEKSVHLLTVNALLGNPGEDAIKQSQKKADYLNLLIKKTERNGKKVVLILDEIHDSIGNFQQKLIFHLWNWHGVIHKIFCISATWNEAGKIVIQYLAELTGDKIQIIESERIKIEAKQSDLYLLLYNKVNYNIEDPEFIDVFRYLIEHGKKLNILSYSKTLSNQLADKGSTIGKLLKDNYSQINLCTSDSDTPFDPKECNIGTKFSTGINIRGNDSAFVVILPSKIAYENRRLGVFSNGINTLIQALARVRDKSEIYILMPAPERLISYESKYVNEVKAITGLNHLGPTEKYKDINRQRELIGHTYEGIKANASRGIKAVEYHIHQRDKERPLLQYPNLGNFILSNGEKVLSRGYDIFGRHFSVYTFWAAFNDQFINCRLAGVTTINCLYFKEGEILGQLKRFAFNKMYEFDTQHRDMTSYLFSLASDKECYEHFRKALFSSSIFVSNSQGHQRNIIPYKDSKFEKLILAFIQLQKKRNPYFIERFYKNYIEFGSLSALKEVRMLDSEYTVKDYMYACFVNAQKAKAKDVKAHEKKLVASYKTLYEFLIGFEEGFASTDKNGKKYFVAEKDVLLKFSNDQKKRLYSAIEGIKEDPLINKKAFGVFQDFSTQSEAQKCLAVYRFFKKTFFKFRFGRVSDDSIIGSDNRREIIVESYQIPQGNLINLLYSPKDAWFDDVTSIGDGVVISYTATKNGLVTTDVSGNLDLLNSSVNEISQDTIG